MTRRFENLVLSHSLAVVLACGMLSGTAAAAQQAPATQAKPKAPTPPRTDAVNPDAKIMADFAERVKKYVELHDSIEAQLPKLPEQATPKQIDTHQRDFAARMAKARAGAKQGDIFGRDMPPVVRKLMGQLISDAKSRRQLRDSIMDDNPGASKTLLTINGRYPDAVPLSTMPPDVLTNLPKLPEAVEYSFVGENLILLDPDAHIVVDYVARALPQ